MTLSSRITAWLGRSLVSIIFIVIGLSQIFFWEEADNDLAFALANWEIHPGNVEQVGSLLSGLVAFVPVILAIGIALQLLGGGLLFLNINVRFAASLLLFYTFCATVIYFPFWNLDGPALNRTLVLFLKNLAIFGGLVVILGMGKGVKKMDRVRVKRNVRKSHDENDYEE